MGYGTAFVIVIAAPTTARKLEIAKTIVRLARIGTKGETESLEEFEKEVTLSFGANWYSWDQDVRGDWYDREKNSIREGLHLEEGETLNIEGFGDNTEDVWRAFVSKRKFSQEHCLRVDWINKRPCDDDEIEPCDDEETEPFKCPGCQGCAERVPIYE